MQERYIVHETSEDYKLITLPYLEEHHFPLEVSFSRDFNEGSYFLPTSYALGFLYPYF